MKIPATIGRLLAIVKKETGGNYKEQVSKELEEIFVQGRARGAEDMRKEIAHYLRDLKGE